MHIVRRSENKIENVELTENAPSETCLGDWVYDFQGVMSRLGFIQRGHILMPGECFDGST